MNVEVTSSDLSHINTGMIGDAVNLTSEVFEKLDNNIRIAVRFKDVLNPVPGITTRSTVIVSLKKSQLKAYI